MATGTGEIHLEEDVVKYLTAQGGEFSEYTQKNTNVYDKSLCLIPEDVITFIKTTQAKKYKKLATQYGTQTNEKILFYLDRAIKQNKTLHVLRKGVRFGGEKINFVYFKPRHNRSPEHKQWYQQNQLTVIRQLKYSTQNENSIDVVLFVNGLPVATIELKNALTGQRHFHAIKQYMQDREEKEKLFEFRRCLVHFACGTEKVSMTTHLKGKSTYFLPFNQGLVNENPNGFATAYLWEDVLRKDSLLELLESFVNLQTDKEKYYDSKTKLLKEKTKQALIFPRYHQRKVVRKLLKALQTDGVGTKYLIQHSAGSGKSNSIAWLAHQLSCFQQHQTDEKVLFNSVIVITDRRVLNNQIADTIKQFDYEPGSLVHISENTRSEELVKAINNATPIIITTLQRFRVISNSVAQNPNRNYAIIIDEAHSSQTAETAKHLRKSLSLYESEKLDAGSVSYDELIEEEILKSGRQPNLSYFAFTATPKPKTVEIFGTVNKDGEKEAFDIYSMEQAIKEGFIKDVLQNYMHWNRYYKLVKRTEVEDSEYDKKKAVRLLSSYVDLQDHAIEKKARIMIEHFVSNTAKQIQGKARAMLVTRSRLHAVRFKRKFDDIMREMKLPYGALVAFSGTVTDGDTGEDYTMNGMNNLEGKISVPDALKLPQHRILIVANMYQTGFDEPLLHTMFVDKRLGGTSTVQTLSRLNRTTKGKNSTMVLDFVNEPEKIQADFQRYYGGVYIESEQQTDSNAIYDVLNDIEAYSIIKTSELEKFAELFITEGDHKEQLQPILNAIVKRYTEEFEEEQQIEFKATIKSYTRLYSFLSELFTFVDVQLYKYFVLLVNLYKKLPYQKTDLPKEILTEVELDSYKLQHKYTTDLALESQDTALEGRSTEGGVGTAEDDFELLSNIIKTLNETFGLDLTNEDKVDFEKMKDNIYANEDLMSFFNTNNSKDNIMDKFNETIDDELLNFINTKLDLYNKLSDDKVNLMFKRIWFNELYDKRVRGI